ncbi:MAG: glycosyltransferase family 39 protein [Anaerolineae bacterium]|nr:glycosyltransferase family 39 protein [Anaerolineae bacterium]
MNIRGQTTDRSRKTQPSCLAAAGTVFVLLLAFGLRSWALGAANLSFDEVATYYVARRPTLEVIRYVMGAAREHPPAYYVLMTLWLRFAGISEFALRFPSVLIGMLAVSWCYRLGMRLNGQHSGWWSALLCAVVPFSVWAGRTGRMYALVLLLSLMVMESWLRWLAHPDWQHWLGFVVISGIAAMTHYYLVLLWPAQALVLLLSPRRTRPIRKPWILTLAGVGLFVVAFVTISPGIRAMLLEIATRFPYRGFRSSELQVVFTDLYIWGYRPELSWAGLVGLVLTVIGWVIVIRKSRMLGVLMTAWGLVPLVIAHLVPESLETRYLTPIFPALLFGVTALLAQIRWFSVKILAVAGVIGLVIWRIPPFYANPDKIFSTRIATLHTAALPGDALVMNGPWPKLLLRYYQPPESLTVYEVPEKAPPGFSAEVDIPRLEEIFEEHDRVWVSYGAIHWADPQYSVSRWLAEKSFRVFQHTGMALYVPAAPDPITLVENVDLGSRLRLQKAYIDHQAGQTGDIFRIGFDFAGDRMDQYISTVIGLLDAQGQVWQEENSRLGPVHQLPEAVLGNHWRERRGLLLLPGTPPGTYTLAMQVRGEGVEAGSAANESGWIPLGSLEVLPGTAGVNLERLLPQPEGGIAHFDGSLAIVGVEPYAAEVMQGYPTGFQLWWRADAPIRAQDIRVRLEGRETWMAGDFPLAPTRYPTSVWGAGDVVRQTVYFQLPDQLPAGSTAVQIQVLDEMGNPLPVDNATADDGWLDIFTVKVGARTRRYTPPVFRVRQDVRFGDMLRLRGHRLERSSVHRGGSVTLDVYWQAMEKPAQIYAVFNHLQDSEHTTLWHGDSWPQAGIYTTDRWAKNEVVTESYIIEIPAECAPGEYVLYTGVYDPVTGVRLPAVTAQGARLVNDEFVLAILEVLP